MCGCECFVAGDLQDAMRAGQDTGLAAALEPGGWLQDAHLAAIWRESRRAVEMIAIAIARMARDDQRLTSHGRGQVRAAAVVPDEQFAALQHRAYPAQLLTADDDGRLG